MFVKQNAHKQVIVTRPLKESKNKPQISEDTIWEELHKPDFNRVQFEAVRNEAGLNRFVMTPTKWIDTTNAIGSTADENFIAS